MYSPIYMMVKILKSDNRTQSYAHMTFGVLKSMKWRNRLSKFWVYHWFNSQLGQKSSKLHHLGFKFWPKTFTQHFKHIEIWFCKNLKITKNHPHRYFQPYLRLRSCTEASHWSVQGGVEVVLEQEWYHQFAGKPRWSLQQNLHKKSHYANI